MAIRHEAIKQEIACSLKILSHENRAMKTSVEKASDQAIIFQIGFFYRLIITNKHVVAAPYGRMPCINPVAF